LRVVGCVVVGAGRGAGQPGWDVTVVAKVRVSTFFIDDLSEEWVGSGFDADHGADGEGVCFVTQDDGREAVQIDGAVDVAAFGQVVAEVGGVERHVGVDRKAALGSEGG
jgi:hypothetical protein